MCHKMEKGQLVKERRILLEELRRSEAARGQLAGEMDGKQSQQCPLENSSDLFRVKDSVKCTLEEDDRSQRSGLSLRSSVYQQALDAAKREAEGYKQRLDEADSVKRFIEKLERYEQLLAEKDLEIRDLIGKIAEKDAVIKEREQALIKLINEHQKALGAKDLAISNYRQLLDAKDAEIGAAKDGLAAKDVEIAASKAEISANKTEIGKRDAEIVRLNGLIANHGPALAVKDGEINQKDSVIERLIRDIDQTNGYYSTTVVERDRLLEKQKKALYEIDHVVAICHVIYNSEAEVYKWAFDEHSSVCLYDTQRTLNKLHTLLAHLREISLMLDTKTAKEKWLYSLEDLKDSDGNPQPFCKTRAT